MGAISDMTLLIGSIVVVFVAIFVFFRGLRKGIWSAIKRFLKVLIENLP